MHQARYTNHRTLPNQRKRKLRSENHLHHRSLDSNLASRSIKIENHPGQKRNSARKSNFSSTKWANMGRFKYPAPNHKQKWYWWTKRGAINTRDSEQAPLQEALVSFQSVPLLVDMLSIAETLSTSEGRFKTTFGWKKFLQFLSSREPATSSRVTANKPA